MHCRIELDPGVKEPYAVLFTDKKTPEVLEAARMLTQSPCILTGYADKTIVPLYASEIVRIYTEGQNVFAQTAKARYKLRARLYEMEARLEEQGFLRISNSELVNSEKIQRLDISLTGTIGVYLEDGIKTYASRRYVARIKRFFEA